MLILRSPVKVIKGVFDGKMREKREKSGFGLFLENPREVEKPVV